MSAVCGKEAIGWPLNMKLHLQSGCHRTALCPGALPAQLRFLGCVQFVAILWRFSATLCPLLFLCALHSLVKIGPVFCFIQKIFDLNSTG